MSIGVLFDFPGVTQAQYDNVLRNLNPGGSLKKLSDWPVSGVEFHLAGPTGSGWRVVDIWESEAALNAFAQTLMPILKSAGFPDVKPQVFPAYNMVKA